MGSTHSVSRVAYSVLRVAWSVQHAIRLRHIILLFLILGVWTSVMIPLGEGPDELPHFTVTRYIIQHARLPDSAEEHEAFQPPLYYLLSAALTFWIDTRDFVVKANADYALADDAPKTLLLHTRAEAFPYRGWALAWHLMRGLSLLMGAVTIGAIYATTLTLTNERNFALITAALLAFLPGFIFMSAIVNNDNLAAMLAALLSWQIVRSLSTHATRHTPHALQTGALLGLGLLSKTSMLAFLPTIAATLLIAARLGHWSLREWLRANGIVFGLAVLLSGWYYLRNYALYQDWLAWPLVLAANAVRTAPLSVSEWISTLGQVYRSFWLEWIGISLEPLVLLCLSLFTVLAVVGMTFHVSRFTFYVSRFTFHPSAGFIPASAERGAQSARRGHGQAVSRTTHHAPRNSLKPPCRPHHTHLATLFAFHWIIITLSWLRWTQTVLGTGQARLFYPALTSIILFLAFGLRALHPRWLNALVIFLFVLALLMPLHYIAPAYASAPRITALPSGAKPISATFKDKIRLIGWELPANRARPGEVLRVGLYWEALKDLQDDDWLKIQLLDAQDNFMLFKDGSPSAGRDSTDSWRRGEQIASWHRLAIPADARRGVYRLTLGIHPYGRKNWFPIEEEGMPTALGDQLVLAEVTIE